MSKSFFSNIIWRSSQPRSGPSHPKDQVHYRPLSLQVQAYPQPTPTVFGLSLKVKVNTVKILKDGLNPFVSLLTPSIVHYRAIGLLQVQAYPSYAP